MDIRRWRPCWRRPRGGPPLSKSPELVELRGSPVYQSIFARRHHERPRDEDERASRPRCVRSTTTSGPNATSRRLTHHAQTSHRGRPRRHLPRRADPGTGRFALLGQRVRRGHHGHGGQLPKCARHAEFRRDQCRQRSSQRSTGTASRTHLSIPGSSPAISSTPAAAVVRGLEFSSPTPGAQAHRGCQRRRQRGRRVRVSGRLHGLQCAAHVRRIGGLDTEVHSSIR